MTREDEIRILAIGPRNFDEAKWLQAEFCMAAAQCVRAANMAEFMAGMARLDATKRHLHMWLIYRDLEGMRRQYELPVAVQWHASTPAVLTPEDVSGLEERPSK